MEKNELDTLRILNEKGKRGSTVNEVANRTGLTHGGAYELLMRLKEAGYVKGEQQTAQKVWRFYITEKGEEKLCDEDLQMELL